MEKTTDRRLALMEMFYSEAVITAAAVLLQFDPEGAAKEVIALLGWVVIAVAVVVAIMSLFRQAFGKALLMIVAGGLFFAVTQNPTMIGDLGTWFWEDLLGLSGGQ